MSRQYEDDVDFRHFIDEHNQHEIYCWFRFNVDLNNMTCEIIDKHSKIIIHSGDKNSYEEMRILSPDLIEVVEEIANGIMQSKMQDILINQEV